MSSDSFFQEQPVQSPTWVVMGQLTRDAPPRPLPDKPLLASPFDQACQSFGLSQTITYGRLPGGLVMLNWPLNGNDWHHGLERAFAADESAEPVLFLEMQEHSRRFAEALIEVSNGWLSLGEAFPSDSGSPGPAFAAMPYWRGGRRLIGRETVIEQDLSLIHI